MGAGSVDRRRGRRAAVQAPVVIRQIGSSDLASFKEEVTKNVSLAGVYFETEWPEAYTVNDVLVASVSIPESQTRLFPFTRVAGRGRVVRISELSLGSSERRRAGIAVEFAQDVTALSALPSRG